MTPGWTPHTTGWKLAIVLCMPLFVSGMGKRAGLGLTVDRSDPPQAAPKQGLKSSADETARQVTVFAILATPGPPTVDPRLGSVRAQLRKVLPGHGFKLLDVQSKRIETGSR